jgi:hypothetical protein
MVQYLLSVLRTINWTVLSLAVRETVTNPSHKCGLNAGM